MRQDVRQDAQADVEAALSKLLTMVISISVPAGKTATPIQVRTGNGPWSWSSAMYVSFIEAKSASYLLKKIWMLTTGG